MIKLMFCVNFFVAVVSGGATSAVTTNSPALKRRSNSDCGSLYAGALLVYLVSSLAAFGVATIVAGATGREDMRQYTGLSESNPRLAFVMMLALFSLSGIPPLAGFLGKFYLFAAAANGGLFWLVLVGAVNSTVSLYYYLTAIRWMYIERPKPETGAVPPIPVSPAAGVVLGISTVGMLALGLLPQFLRWVEAAAAAGF